MHLFSSLYLTHESEANLSGNVMGHDKAMVWNISRLVEKIPAVQRCCTVTSKPTIYIDCHVSSHLWQSGGLYYSKLLVLAADIYRRDIKKAKSQFGFVSKNISLNAPYCFSWWYFDEIFEALLFYSPICVVKDFFLFLLVLHPVLMHLSWSDYFRKLLRGWLSSEAWLGRLLDLPPMRSVSLSFWRLGRTSVHLRWPRESLVLTREQRRRERRWLVFSGRWGAAHSLCHFILWFYFILSCHEFVMNSLAHFR